MVSCMENIVDIHVMWLNGSIGFVNNHEVRAENEIDKQSETFPPCKNITDKRWRFFVYGYIIAV